MKKRILITISFGIAITLGGIALGIFEWNDIKGIFIKEKEQKTVSNMPQKQNDWFQENDLGDIEEEQGMAKFVKIPYPKLKMSQYSGTFTVITTPYFTTVVLDSKNNIKSYRGHIKGNFSSYERKAFTGKIINTSFILDQIKPKHLNLYNEHQLKNASIPLFDSCRGRLGPNMIFQSSGETVYINNKKKVLNIAGRREWKKVINNEEADQEIYATYSIPIDITNNTKKTINNIRLNIYLKDSNKIKYYPIIIDSSDAKKYSLKHDGNTAFILLNKVSPTEKIEMRISFKAPADDYTYILCVFNEGQEKELENIFRKINFEQEALKEEYINHSADDILKNLAIMGQHAITKQGYYRMLTRMAYIYFRQERYMLSLSILKYLEKNKFSIDKDSVFSLIKILNLIRLQYLNDAIIEITKSNNDTLPEYYKEYLLRACLRQYEIIEVMEKITPKLDAKKNQRDRINNIRTYLKNIFNVNLIVTPIINDSLQGRIEKYATVEGRYNEAVSFYKEKQYGRAQYMLMYIIANSPETKIKQWNEKQYAGLVSLDILGQLFVKVKLFEDAKVTFKKMVDEYPNDEYHGPFDGEGAYGGPGGAQGLVYQLWIYMNNYWFTREENLKPDYDSAIEVAYRLIEEYKGIQQGCWEGCSTYDELAVNAMIDCLTKMNVSVDRFSSEINHMISLLENEILIANLRYRLAMKYEENNDYVNAKQIYQDIVEKHNALYYINEYNGFDFKVYSLEALTKIQGIMILEGATEKELEEIANKIAENYTLLKNDLDKKNKRWVKEPLEKWFENYKHVLEEKSKTIIAVNEFEVQNISAIDTRVIADLLRKALTNLKVFNIFDSRKMDEILAKQKLHLDGCANIDCAIKIGKILNVQKIIVGTFSKVLNQYYITADLINIETEEVELSKVSKFNSLKNLETEVDKLAKRLMGRSVEDVTEQIKIDPQAVKNSPENIIEKEETIISPATFKEVLKSPITYKDRVVQFSGQIKSIKERNWEIDAWWSEGPIDKIRYKGKTFITLKNPYLEREFAVVCPKSVKGYIKDYISVTGNPIGDNWSNNQGFGMGGAIILHSFDNEVKFITKETIYLEKNRQENNGGANDKEGNASNDGGSISKDAPRSCISRHPINHKNKTVAWSGQIEFIKESDWIVEVQWRETKESASYKGKTFMSVRDSTSGNKFAVICPGSVPVYLKDKVVVTGKIVGDSWKYSDSIPPSSGKIVIYSEKNLVKIQE